MNIRQARNKIKSVTNVRKITKAMQLVSAIKMKKAQMKALDGRPYQEHLENMIRKISAKLDTNLSILLGSDKFNNKKRNLAVVISTNKGLCGGFNMNLFRFIVKNTDFNNTDFVIMGKKASILGKFGAKVIADYSTNNPLENVSAIFEMALNHFQKGDYNNIILYYNKFISTLKVEPTKYVLLPLSLPESTDKTEKTDSIDYTVEPNPEEIINPLLYSFVEDTIQNAIIQSEAGEHSSRMIAMKNATENANDVIYSLTMLRNKLRQEKITNELLDMITAKESVEVN
jgi:F-type H+-transporting ATPase subunit gamma